MKFESGRSVSASRPESRVNRSTAGIARGGRPFTASAMARRIAAVGRVTVSLRRSTTEGAFMTILKKDAVLALAKQQPGRQLAVVAMIRYGTDGQDEEVKHDWTTLLTEVGYRRIVFLRARNSMKMNGLPVLANGG